MSRVKKHLLLSPTTQCVRRKLSVGIKAYQEFYAWIKKYYVHSEGKAVFEPLLTIFISGT